MADRYLGRGIFFLLLASAGLSGCGSSFPSEPARVLSPDALDRAGEKPLIRTQARKEMGLSFDLFGARLVPVDFLNVEASFVLDPARHQSVSRVRVTFRALDSGNPYFDFAPRVSRLTVGLTAGPAPTPAKLLYLADPSGSEVFRALDRVVVAQQTYVMELEYALPKVRWLAGGGVDFALKMGDLSPRRYLEQYLPANFLHDAYPLTLHLNVKNSPKPIQIFTNGKLAAPLGASDREAFVSFPEFYNSTCHYFHVTTTPMKTARAGFESVQPNGKKLEVPVLLYTDSGDGALLEDAMKVAVTTLKKYDGLLGPYAHDAFLGYIYARDGGGMEYAGATDSSLGALPHEILHSWYARGAIAGNDGGWIDEAAATWFDSDMPRADEIFERDPIEFAGRSPLYRMTRWEAYGDGSLFLAEIDHITGGGMLKALSAFYREYRQKPFSTREFLDFLLASFPQHATAITNHALQYVYGLSCDVIESPVIARGDYEMAFGTDSVLIDVMKNDVSCGLEGLELEAADPVSAQGARIDKVELFPGYWVLKYSPISETAGIDRFFYRIRNYPPAEVVVTRRPYHLPEQVTGTPVAGLKASYFDIASFGHLPDFTKLNAYKTDVVPALDLGPAGDVAGSGKREKVAAVFEGLWWAESDGLYFVGLESDDGSSLRIGDLKVVSNDGTHQAFEKRSKVALRRGYHRIRVEYFQGGGAWRLALRSGPTADQLQPIPAAQLFHLP